MSTSSLVHVAQQVDQFPVETTLVSGVEGKPTGYLTSSVPGGLGRMALNRQRVRVGSNRLKRRLDSAVKFHRVLKAPQLVLGSGRSLCDYGGEIVLVNLHGLQR